MVYLCWSYLIFCCLPVNKNNDGLSLYLTDEYTMLYDKYFCHLLFQNWSDKAVNKNKSG